jgi:lysophospholipase L1-like esterase
MDRSVENSQALRGDNYRGKWIRRVIAIVMGCFLAVAVAEVALRALSQGATIDRWAVPHPRYGFVHRANFKQTVVRPWVNTTYVWHVSINSLGFRGPEPDLSDTKALRILLLGDSFTFGYGVEYEQTFGAILQSNLLAGGVTAMVFNAGVTGWGSAQEFLFAADNFDKLKPDIIVVTFCENDPIEDEIFARGGSKGVLPSFPGKRWVRDHSRLYGAVYNAVSSLLYNRYLLAKKANNQTTQKSAVVAATNVNTVVQPVDRFGGLEWYYRTMDLFRDFSGKFRRANPNGHLLVQVVEFWRNDFRDVMQVLDNEGQVRFVNLREDAGDWSAEDVRLPFDPHWNPAMHQVAADRLTREILGLLKKQKDAL